VQKKERGVYSQYSYKMKKTKLTKREKEAVNSFLVEMQEGLLADEGKKYTFKELRKMYDYEIQVNIIPQAYDLLDGVLA